MVDQLVLAAGFAAVPQWAATESAMVLADVGGGRHGFAVRG
jgi:hypothetical protein